MVKVYNKVKIELEIRLCFLVVTDLEICQHFAGKMIITLQL